jgi:hypothetical protein
MSKVVPATPPTSTMVQRPVWWIRLVLVVIGIAAWRWTQSLIGQRPPVEGVIWDGLHQLTAPLHWFLLENPPWADAVLIVGSAFIDLLGFFLLVWSIIGPTFRPFLGLLILFGMRQICQAVCALPPPEGMIWRDPGFPSVLVTYQVANDLFFSGHTAIAVYGAVELIRLGRRWLIGVAVMVALFEVISVIVLRAHYTIDVFAGIIAALYVAGISAKLAPLGDQALIRAFGRG